MDRQVGIEYDSGLSINFNDAIICNSVRDASHMRDKGTKGNQRLAFKLSDPSETRGDISRIQKEDYRDVEAK